MLVKRINLLVNEDLLEKAAQAFGVKSYSATVNLALAEVLRMKKIQNLPHFFGRRLWQGDLSEMRGDPRRSARRPSRQQK